VSPDAVVKAAGLVVSLFQRVERRVRVVESLRAARTGGLVLAGLALAGRLTGWAAGPLWTIASSVALVLAGALLWRSRVRWSQPAVGTVIEQALPESHNVLFTARELVNDPRDVAPWMRRHVIAAAGAVAAAADPSVIVPLGRDASLMALALALIVAIAAGAPQRLARAARDVAARVENGSRSAPVPPLTIRVQVTPPDYIGAAPTTLVNPERLDVVQGSRIAVSLDGQGWRLRFGDRMLTQTGGDKRAEVVAQDSGYFAVEHEGGGDRRLIPVAVSPDRAPTVRIEVPGKDMLLPAARGTVQISTSASDDFGVRTLELVYTKVSGTGEQFEFTQGSLPLSIVKPTSRTWKGTAAFDLAQLKLEPGDSLVYHAVARDARPGDAGAATSDTFFVEIAGPGQVALPGFELPPDRERYALSQQMIVLKLQRLLARQSTLTREALEQELGGIAAEQRAVRANFVFLMGGHVEDEEEEAEQSSEIQEGRLQNNARREINTAIKFMSDAEQQMIAVSTAGALPPAKSAVDALQRAFGHNRYFLRTLAERSRIDPSRRLSGDLKEARDWRRTLLPPAGDARVDQARSILSTLLRAAAAPRIDEVLTADAAGTLAERALATDPSSTDWQATSSALNKLRDLVSSGKPDAEQRAVLNAAVAPLVRLGGAAVRGGTAEDVGGGLRGTWADEARRR
jgi:hypothetical protein